MPISIGGGMLLPLKEAGLQGYSRSQAEVLELKFQLKNNGSLLAKFNNQNELHDLMVEQDS
jgi:hypothetical protein